MLPRFLLFFSNRVSFIGSVTRFQAVVFTFLLVVGFDLELNMFDANPGKKSFEASQRIDAVGHHVWRAPQADK